MEASVVMLAAEEIVRFWPEAKDLRLMLLEELSRVMEEPEEP